MTRTRTALTVPLWIAVFAMALLALVLRAQPVLAPSDVLRPAVISVERQSSPPSSPIANGPTSRTISASPATVAPATHQAATSEPPASAPAQCPAQSGSGLPCQLP